MDNPTARFDAFLKEQGLPVAGVSGAGKDCRIDQGECTNEQLKQAIELAAAFDWSVKPEPDLEGFKLSVLESADLKPEAKANLMKFAAVMNDYLVNPKAVMQAWSLILAGDALITPEVAAVVEKCAADANMPLT